MGMEHRWNTRKHTAFEAVIHYPALGLVRGKVKNIGLGGMGIETSVITLNPNTAVDLTVRVRRHGAGRLLRLHAWIVWAAPDRAGLMFRAFDDTTYAALQELVFEHQGRVGEEGTLERSHVRKHA